LAAPTCSDDLAQIDRKHRDTHDLACALDGCSSHHGWPAGGNPDLRMVNNGRAVQYRLEPFSAAVVGQVFVITACDIDAGQIGGTDQIHFRICPRHCLEIGCLLLTIHAHDRRQGRQLLQRLGVQAKPGCDIVFQSLVIEGNLIGGIFSQQPLRFRVHSHRNDDKHRQRARHHEQH
jgi:hypothetical protein